MSIEDEQKLKAPILEKYETEGHPLYATARLWDDGVIDPKDTRAVLAKALRALRGKPRGGTEGELGRGVFRM